MKCSFICCGFFAKSKSLLSEDEQELNKQDESQKKLIESFLAHRKYVKKREMREEIIMREEMSPLSGRIR